jgi:hypothetical protein
VDDLREELPHLAIDDEFGYHPQSDVSDDDYLLNRPAFFGSLTIAMPEYAKCGPGRPLVFQQKALFIWQGADCDRQQPEICARISAIEDGGDRERKNAGECLQGLHR